MARHRLMLSQRALAEEVGVQRSAVSQWEAASGKNPTLKNLRRVAQVTAVQFEWLATGRGPMALSKDVALDAISAADALLVEDRLEVRMIAAMRCVSLESRVSLVEIAEQIAKLRTGRTRHPTHASSELALDLD